MKIINHKNAERHCFKASKYTWRHKIVSWGFVALKIQKDSMENIFDRVLIKSQEKPLVKKQRVLT